MRRASHHVTFGGEAPAGWLPPVAATPPATPERIILLDIEVRPEAGGFLLEWAPSEGQDVPRQPPFAGDLWYEDLDDALTEAETAFCVAWPLRSWQKSGRRPSVLTHGLESPYDGPVDSMVNSAKAVTLLTINGHEVQVRVIAEPSAETYVRAGFRRHGEHPVGSVTRARIIEAMR